MKLRLGSRSDTQSTLGESRLLINWAFLDVESLYKLQLRDAVLALLPKAGKTTGPRLLLQQVAFLSVLSLFDSDHQPSDQIRSDQIIHSNIIIHYSFTMKEMDYNTISRVTETWETCRRRSPDFENEVGTKMLTKYVLIDRILGSKRKSIIYAWTVIDSECLLTISQGKIHLTVLLTSFFMNIYFIQTL